MAQSYEINDAASIDGERSIKHETERAKLYLQTFCPEAGDNFYDHLSEVLGKILMERPRNIFSSFEECSKRILNDRLPPIHDNLCDEYVPPSPFKNAKKLLQLFKANLSANQELQSLEEGAESIIEPPSELPNMFDLLHFFEPANIGLPRTQMVLLNLSIRKLIAEEKIEDARFWGKILGRSKNYYIVEASLSEFELERRLQELNKQEELRKEEENENAKEDEEEDAELKALEVAMPTNLSDEEGQEEDDDNFEIVFPPIQKNTWEPIPEVIEEEIGTGANTKVYFVCNSPGIDNWVELPSVTPQQIVVARKITHLFTGDLESPLHTFPPFPGNEKNYLRAQIARIGADTHISPIGYFKFGNDIDGEDEGEEEEEEDDGEEEDSKGKKVVKNRHYNSLPVSDLIDPSNWCHHCPHILKQGRVIWQDPSKPRNGNEDDGEDEEEEDEEEEGSGEEEEASEKDSAFVKEIAPPLLTPLTEDPGTEFTTPWTGRLSSKIQPDTAVALLRSNIWPGAYAVAVNKKFANLYIGWGCKQNVDNYNPPSMPDVQDQYEIDSELVEIQDPTFEEEEAYRIAHLPPVSDGEGEEEDDNESVDEDSIEND